MFTRLTVRDKLIRRRDNKEFTLEQLRDHTYLGRGRGFHIEPMSMIFRADDGEEIRFEPTKRFLIKDLNAFFTKVGEERLPREDPPEWWCWQI